MHSLPALQTLHSQGMYNAQPTCSSNTTYRVTTHLFLVLNPKIDSLKIDDYVTLIVGLISVVIIQPSIER